MKKKWGDIKNFEVFLFIILINFENFEVKWCVGEDFFLRFGVWWEILRKYELLWWRIVCLLVFSFILMKNKQKKTREFYSIISTSNLHKIKNYVYV
jgi:hypothetical protein